MMELLYIICLVAIFFLAGLNKVGGFKGTVKGLQGRMLFRNLPQFFSTLAIAAVVVLEIAAPILMVYGLYDTRYRAMGYYSCAGLLLFTVLATALYHNPLVEPSQKMAFLKNLSIIGGLGCALSYY